jgi:hypothetical protein
MQMRLSLLSGDRPTCPVNVKHCIHDHGAYWRYANCDDLEKAIKVLRYLCYRCGHTISVLPDEILPYRPLKTELVEEHFDTRSGEQPEEVELTEKESGCLKRAWHRFTRRLNALTSVLGQMMQIRLSDAKLIWIQLRRLGNLKVILHLLGRKFKTSLLGDYRCLKPWRPKIP